MLTAKESHVCEIAPVSHTLFFHLYQDVWQINIKAGINSFSASPQRTGWTLTQITNRIAVNVSTLEISEANRSIDQTVCWKNEQIRHTLENTESLSGRTAHHPSPNCSRSRSAACTAPLYAPSPAAASSAGACSPPAFVAPPRCTALASPCLRYTEQKEVF